MKPKYLIFIFFYLFILLILPFIFRDKKVLFADIEKVVNPYITSELIKQNPQDISKKYNFNNEYYDDYISYVNASFMDVDEITIFEVKDAKKQNKVIHNLNEYCEAKKKTFLGYGPNQVKLIDKRIIEKKGNYVFLIISKNNKEIWNKIEKLY